MATNYRPKNSTPQRLNLKSPNFPRMPFSSPMGEEVLSPKTPNPSRTPPQDRRRDRQHCHGQENTREDQQNLSLLKPTRGEWEENRERDANKSRWPGLNVVTNFSGRDLDNEQQCGGDRNNRGVLPGERTRGFGHQQSGKSLKSAGSKSRLDELRRASSKASNLSPSDRAVVIGISIPPDELGEQTMSPDADLAEDKLDPEPCERDRHRSVTPTIVVTSAKQKAPWSSPERERLSPPQHRPASSVYSQAPPPRNRIIDSSIVPPVPPLPPDAQNRAGKTAKKNGSGPPSRVVSSDTIFDEDDSPVVGGRVGADSRQSQIRMLERPSMDSITTKHRSQGWWNHIMSPFFPRSPMTFKSPAEKDEHVPPLPSPGKISPPPHDRSLDEPKYEASPDGADRKGLASGHTSWTGSTLEPEFEKLQPAIYRPYNPNGLDKEIKSQSREPERDSAFIPSEFEGLGAAAEYFEACLYDMHSPTPYFECENHTCNPHLTAPSASSRDVGDVQGSDTRERKREEARPIGLSQVPTNRFSAAFHEAITSNPKVRPESEATIIEDLDVTPDVQEAHAAPILRAPEPVPAVQPFVVDKEPQPPMDYQHDPETAAAPPQFAAVRPLISEECPESARETRQSAQAVAIRSPSAGEFSSPRLEKPVKRFVAVMPPDRPQPAFEEPLSPEPLSPGAQRQAPRDEIGMEEVHINRKPLPQNTYVTNHYYGEPSDRRSEEQTTMADLYPPPRNMERGQRTCEFKEKILPPRQKKSRLCPRFGNCFRRDRPMSKKKKWALIAIAAGLIVTIILIIVLAMTLTRKGDKMAIQTRWLNITGYPPMPTGVSTIAQPDAVNEDSGCVHPSTIWSCAVPKEEQQSIAPNAPDQPNFRVEIRFQNGTNVTATSTSSVGRRSDTTFSNRDSASSFLRGRLLHIRDAFSNALFTPSPSPPSQEDQQFLGNTTDGKKAPFDGEYTPFFMSFESPTKMPASKLFKRDTNDTDPFPDLTKAIPPPDTNPDGTFAAANLLPFPSAQPLRLYNRGSSEEHYGFYNYFDRSIFLKSTALLNDSNHDEISPVPDDENGGTEKNAATVRCTWAQTRFLVQIWTQKGDSLLQGNGTSQAQPSGNATNLTSSSANDFNRPGSFPYPVTITLDRHGGDVHKKQVYCYGVNDREQPIADEKKYQVEDRGFGGQLANPANGPFGDTNVTLAQGGPGGIDGGSGGCRCRWQNWG